VINGNEAIEVKNYTLVDNAGTGSSGSWSASKNIENLINRSAKQATDCVAILGDDYVQILQIDIRGQNVSQATRTYIETET
jgi:hypothetical protein